MIINTQSSIPQSDWNQTNNNSPDFIKNKPTIPDISGKADKATTLAGYGITDANINNGTITLGSGTITPITSYQDIFSLFYPVGTIYQTEDSTFNPNVTWGGTWVRIEDKFLVASGEVYTSTGGSASASVTLTVNNLPSHNHGFTPSGSVESTFTGSEVTSGAGSAHSHTRGDMNITGTMTGRNIVRDGSWSGALYNAGSSYYCDGGAGTKSGGVGLKASNNWSGSTSSESSHTHSVTAAGSVSSSFTGTSGNTDSAGSGVAFSVPTIPPYQAVFIWKRTA